jgi:hypothetical protein
MFVLLIDDRIAEDGKTYTYRPFQITIADVGDTLAGFITAELAEYFRSYLKLENEYNAVDIMQLDKEKISDCRYLCVFQTKREIQNLLDVTRKRRHRLIEISSLRSDID